MNEFNSIGNARLIIREVSKVIVGKDESLIKILLAIIAGGHILMEDIIHLVKKLENLVILLKRKNIKV